MRLGKVVKSNSHCDYVVQVYDSHEVDNPPDADKYGFGSFVKLETDDRHWAVGIIYNSQLFNPMFLNTGPRLSSEPDPLFSPDLVSETRTLLGTVLVGTLQQQNGSAYGQQGIPRVVVPVNALVATMTTEEIYRFHLNEQNQPQVCYYSHLLHCGGNFAKSLTQQVLQELIDSGFFGGSDRRALQMLCKELSWKQTIAAMR